MSRGPPPLHIHRGRPRGETLAALASAAERGPHGLKGPIVDVSPVNSSDFAEELIGDRTPPPSAGALDHPLGAPYGRLVVAGLGGHHASHVAHDSSSRKRKESLDPVLKRHGP